jgi:hypothetical protein
MGIMTWKEMVNLLAIILGPILAIQVSQIIEHYKQKRERQLYIFKVLMSTRATPLDVRHVEALNMIDVEFDGKNKKSQDVLSAWKDYLDHLNSRETSGEVWSSKKQDLFVELLYTMALYLNYNFEKSAIRKTSYFPEGLGQVQEIQRTILECFGEILNGKKGFPVTIFPEADEDTKEKTENIINGLEEIVLGKRSIAVSNESKK